MENQYLETSPSPIINFHVGGHLFVKGWDEPKVQVFTPSDENLVMDQDGDQINLRCNNQCTINVPSLATLNLKAVQGHADIKALEGAITAEVINGNLELRSVGPVTLQKINGNITAKDIDGDLTVGVVNGSLTVRDIQGNLNVQDRLNGNLNLTSVDGNATATAKGNVNLRLDPTPGKNYDFKAAGNIVCRLAEDSSVKIFVEKANKIIIRLPQEIDAVEEDESAGYPEAPYTRTIGGGDANMKLTASGNVILGSEAPEWDFVEDIDIDLDDEISEMSEAITEQVQQQLENQMEMLEQQLDIQMELLSTKLGMAGLSEDEARRIEERSRQAAERATRRAQERMRRAQERLERKLAAAQRKAEQKARIAARKARAHRSHSWSYRVPTPPSPPDAEPVSDEERLVILKMLEQKKITPEEAEQLLEALEGGGA